MNRTNIFLIAVGYILLNPITTDAQQRNHISMEDAVAIAAKNNANIQIAELDSKISTANYHQTDAVFLPQLSVNYTAMVTSNPLNAFGFLLQQGIATAQDFEPLKLNNPGATRNYGTSIDAKLPIFNLDMIYARKGAKLQQDVYKYKSAYTKKYITFEVKKAYTQLQFAYQLRFILLGTLADVKQIHQSVNNFYKQGLVQKSDVLNAEVQVNTIESALSKASSNIENASEGLNLLAGNAQDKQNLYSTDSLTQEIYGFENTELSETRSDIMAMKTALNASKMMAKSSNMALLPKINAFGSYQFNDSKAFGFNKNSYMAGISLTWNIFSGNQNMSKIKSANYTTDRINKEVNQFVDKSRLELNKTLRDLNDLQTEIKKHDTSVAQATEALRILNNRFKEGLVSTTDLLTAQAQLSQQRIELAQAIMSYNITKYYTELLTSNY
ncbi:MAG: TolC family protein [Prevotella sp.]|jgi:outer membrane protein TolC|nr:TolC family protein [Prevotella sp.]